MALSKGRTTQELHAGFVQPCYLYENEHGGGASLQVFDPSPLDFFFHKSHSKAMLEDSGTLEPLVDYSTTLSHQPSLSEPSNSSSTSGFTFGTPNSRPKEPQSVVRFKTAASDYSLRNVSMLNFEQEPDQYNQLKLNYGEDSASWADTIFPGHQVLHLNRRSGTDPRAAQEVNCFKGTSGYGAAVNGVKEHQREEEFGWVFPEEQHDDLLHGSRGTDGGAHKRPCMADEAPCSKRPSASNRKSKSKAITSKDTQSIAAKNRRERITERLKILQALVPNGTKVDLVAMLEKAISYVKFLQLQVKVLSTDEFWPSHGGKAPEVTQVKEAIDAILSSHKERNFDAK